MTLAITSAKRRNTNRNHYEKSTVISRPWIWRKCGSFMKPTSISHRSWTIIISEFDQWLFHNAWAMFCNDGKRPAVYPILRNQLSDPLIGFSKKLLIFTVNKITES